MIWRGHMIIADNGGHLMCIDLNTLQVKWVQDTLDDTNCTGVLTLEGEDHHPYVYMSTSFTPTEGQGYPNRAHTHMEDRRRDRQRGYGPTTNYNCQTIAKPNQVSGGVQGSFASGKNDLEGLIFVPVSMTEGMKGELVALNKSDGTVKWRYTFQGYPWSLRCRYMTRTARAT